MRILIALSTVLALASAASAATLTIVADKQGYLPGETITLTIYGDNEGAVSTTYSLLGRLVFDPGLLDHGTVGTATHPGGGWVDGGTTQGFGFVEVFNFADFSFSGAAPNYNVPGGVVINTVTLIMESNAGNVQVDWSNSLSFFGLTSAPGILIRLVPEPTTGALLALGLLALGICRGRERRSCER
jgi:PEP-CTERM motif